MNIVGALKSTWFWIFQKEGSRIPSKETDSGKEDTTDVHYYSRKFLNNPVVEQEMSTNCKPLWRIKIWNTVVFASGDDSFIRVIDKGKKISRDERQTLSGNSPDDFAVEKTGTIIYVDWQEQEVCQLRNNGEMESVLKLKGWKPWAICCSVLGDVLVAMRSENTKHARVVGYQGNTKTREYKLDQKGQALFGSPMFLTENKNQDVCVSDSLYNRVTVVNYKGNLKFHYLGNQAATRYPTFYPKGIATNSQCNIIVADQENNCIHILDQVGQLIRYISENEIPLREPYCLHVGKEDELYVGEYHQGTIKEIRYLQ